MLAGWKHEGKNGTEIQTCDFLHNALTQLRELARNALQRATTRQMANTICLVWLRRWCLAPWKNQSFLFRLSTQLSLEGFFFCKVFSGQMQLQKMQVSKKNSRTNNIFLSEGTWPTLISSIDHNTHNTHLVSRWRTVTGSGLSIYDETCRSWAFCAVSSAKAKHQSSKHLPELVRSMHWRPAALKPTSCTSDPSRPSGHLFGRRHGRLLCNWPEVQEVCQKRWELGGGKPQDGTTSWPAGSLYFWPTPTLRILIRLKVGGCELVVLMINSFVVGSQQLHKTQMGSARSRLNFRRQREI